MHIETQLIKTSNILKDYFSQKYSERIMIALRTKGCSWAKERKGGCFHCQIPYTPLCNGDDNILIKQFLSDFKKYDYFKIPVLSLYTPGSFFDDEELNPRIREKILETISYEKNMKYLMLESLPQFITEKKIQQLRRIIPHAEIEIGIGLDSSNDKIRKNNINKNFTLEDFKKALLPLKKYNIRILAYILFKPPFLSEKESIIDAINSIKDAFHLGVDLVSIEVMNIQEDSKVHRLYSKGLYKLPWLWGVIKVLKATHHLGEIRIGTLVYPPALQFASNCKICSSCVLKVLNLFNTNQDINTFDNINCKCYKKWVKLC